MGESEDGVAWEEEEKKCCSLQSGGFCCAKKERPVLLIWLRQEITKDVIERGLTCDFAAKIIRVVSSTISRISERVACNCSQSSCDCYNLA